MISPLEHPHFRQAVLDLEDRYIRVWRNTGPADQAAREEAYYLQRALVDLIRDLRGRVEQIATPAVVNSE